MSYTYVQNYFININSVFVMTDKLKMKTCHNVKIFMRKYTAYKYKSFLTNRTRLRNIFKYL